ncbi:MAG: YbjN domain-containing protein [Coriobacteriia bacterium]|nr:YbjN domain-containing protein [Coriobacteriia bacterium]
MQTIEATRRKIESTLNKAGLKFKMDGQGDFWVPFEDAIVFVGPASVGEVATARVWSMVAIEIDSLDTDGLLRFLNEQNCKMVFGKLCWYPDQRTVTFETPIVAEALDKPELQFAVLVAAKMTDTFNDTIVARWGGRKFVA